MISTENKHRSKVKHHVPKKREFSVSVTAIDFFSFFVPAFSLSLGFFVSSLYVSLHDREIWLPKNNVEIGRKQERVELLIREQMKY